MLPNPQASSFVLLLLFSAIFLATNAQPPAQVFLLGQPGHSEAARWPSGFQHAHRSAITAISGHLDGSCPGAQILAQVNSDRSSWAQAAGWKASRRGFVAYEEARQARSTGVLLTSEC